VGRATTAQLSKVDGRSSILLAPPYIVENEQLDTIVERLGEAVDAATDA
jgi:adenosylmethionine-8-amino-7-oxononanoate aminotransferase